MIRKVIQTKTVRCAVYTRKSTEEGLQQEFNSLDAQRESGEAYISSQQHEGWVCLPEAYDDGGYSGGNMDRPAMQRLLADIQAGKIDCVVVYKVDRLSRSLLDFAKLMETFDKYGVSFIRVTQAFNTRDSMGRLMLNVLLSFAQFERELVSERTRDKIAASRRKGKWCGGMPVLGYDVVNTKLVVNADEAEQLRQIYKLYIQHRSLLAVVDELNRRGWRTKTWTTKKTKNRGGRPYDKTVLHKLLTNPVYIGKVRYKTELHSGEHQPIIDEDTWEQVQTLLAHNCRSGGADVRNRYAALLKGLLRCSACDCAMTHTFSAKGTRRYRYYVCTQAQKRGWDQCPTKSVPAGEIERFVVDQIKCIGRDPELVAETIAQVHRQADERTAALAAERGRLQRELAKHHRDVKDAVTAAVGDKTGLLAARLADLQERVRTTESRLTELTAELDTMTTNVPDDATVAAALAQFDQVWDVLSPREQAQLFQLLIERVVYDGRERTIAITFQPLGLESLTNMASEVAA